MDTYDSDEEEFEEEVYDGLDDDVDEEEFEEEGDEVGTEIDDLFQALQSDIAIGGSELNYMLDRVDRIDENTIIVVSRSGSAWIIKPE